MEIKRVYIRKEWSIETNKYTTDVGKTEKAEAKQYGNKKGEKGEDY